MIKLCSITVAGLALFAASSAPAQDAAEGGVAFKQKCMMCHTITAGAKGTAAPNLRGVGNRAAASTAFAYSAALKQANIKWTAVNLDKFLTAPNKMVPGTRMIVAIPDPKKRADVVAYLMALK